MVIQKAKGVKVTASMLVLGALIAGPGVAFAAEAQTITPAAPDANTIGEVVVTAQKREENLQKVPIPITAFTGGDIIAKGIQNTKDLQQFTPGLQFSQNVVFGQAYIRGIGSNQLNIGSDEDVATIIDGVYVARPVASIQNFLDLNNVEVLKGPQGTLYGRNATGGVINIVSNSPTKYWSGDIEAQYGNYNDLEAHGTISGPLVSDWVLGRFSVGSEHRDGFMTNIYNGQKVDDLKLTQAKGMVDFLLPDNLKVRVSLDGSKEDDTRGDAGYVSEPGPATLSKHYAIKSDRFHADINSPIGTVVNLAGGSVSIDKGLGDLTATSITAFRYSDFDLALDLDFTGYNYANNAREAERSDAVTQEFRLASPSNTRLTWIAGLYFIHESATTVNNYNFFYANSILDTPGKAKTTAYAAFGQASFALTNQIKLTAGLRYSDENRRVDVKNISSVVKSFKGSLSNSALTPKFGIEYTFMPNVLFYASATNGFKSGGFNATSVSNPAFRPEKVWSYEAGAKTELFDRRLRLNGSVFYEDYSDLQVTVSVPGLPSTITNAASAKIDGAEFEADALVARHLTLNAGISLLDATYDKYSSIDSEHTALGVQNLHGFTMPRSPKSTFNTGAAYNFDLEPGALTTRIDYSYTSKIYFTSFDTPYERQKAYGIVNGRITFAPRGTSWTMSAYGKNLLNQEYSQLILSNKGFYGTVRFPGAPQQFGFSVEHKF